MVSVEQQLVDHKEKAKDLVVFQLKRLDVLTIPIWCLIYSEIIERRPCLVTIGTLKK